MSRTTIFKGKVADEPNEWVYGYLVREDVIFQPKEHEETKCCSVGTFAVKKQTICEWTGLFDTYGRKIYTGDIVRFLNQIGEIVYECGSYGIGISNDAIDYKKIKNFTKKELDNDFDGTFCDNFLPLFEIYWNFNNVDDFIDEIKVIGNIFDNPELLGGAKCQSE